MPKTVNLRTGNITKSIVSLALPLMGMSFIQMAYNLTDMFWIGKLGAGPVASVGTGGLLIWMAIGLHTMAQLGGQVYVAQNLGRDDRQTAGQFASAAILLSLLISTVLGLTFYFARTPIVAFFNLTSPDVILGAEQYLAIVGGLVIFQLQAKLFTALITTTGDSHTPFIATMVGLVLNIFIDPMLIFGWFGLPALGIQGAAIATVFAQVVVLLVLLRHAKKGGALFDHVSLKALPAARFFKDIVRLGTPTTLQATLFPLIAMVLSRMVAGFGDNAVAVQRIGTQVESISWMTSEGFAIAVNSFIAQNYGANDIQRVKQGYYNTMKMVLCWGICASAVLILGATSIFQIFIAEEEVIALGRDYLIILGLSQLLMCAEIVSGSAMNALGRTMVPAIVVTIFTLMRIPLAMLLTSQTDLGLNGIWWSVTISSNCKGLVLTGIMLWIVHKKLFPATKPSTLTP